MRFSTLNRRAILVFAAIVLVSACDGKMVASNPTGVRPVPTDSLVVKQKYQSDAAKLSALFETGDCANFVRQFPDTFPKFSEMYGFDDDEGESPLYKLAESHIPYLFECSGVSQSERIEKSIGIAIGGKWDADAVALLQERLIAAIFANPDEFKNRLSNLNDSQAASFWYFVLDSPEVKDPEVLKTYQRLRALFADRPKIAKLIDEQRVKIIATGH